MPQPTLNMPFFFKPTLMQPSPFLTSTQSHLATLAVDNNIYYTSYADKAQWASGQLTDADNMTDYTPLAWMGSEADSNGFVRLDNNILMEDGAQYTALRTHPKWVNNGTLKGWMPWLQQNGTGVFMAQVGFLSGARATDGVTFQVWVHYHVSGVEHWTNVIHQQKLYTGELLTITADLSSWQNQEIAIELRVDAGASSGQDWAAWINPRIEISTIPGPIVNGDNSPCFDDRYDENKKWYLPNFDLKQPLKDNFTFSCHKNTEPDENGNPTYNGEIIFTLSKNTPSVVTGLIASNPEITYTEVPVTNLLIEFVLAFKDKQPITYSGTFSQTNNDFKFTLEPGKSLSTKDQEDYLLVLFNFISNKDNAPYCTLSLTASYTGYVPKVFSVRLASFQNSFRSNNALLRMPFNHIAAASSTLFRPDTADIIRPVAAASTPSAFSIIDHPLESYTYNAAIPFSQTINNVNYPCSGANDYPENYILVDSSGHSIPFACHPPFGDASAQNYTSTAFSPPGVVLTDYGINNIYLNTANYNYKIIPTKYTIMLKHSVNAVTEDQLIPAAYLNTIIDDNNAGNCLANLTFHIAPEISAYQLWRIQKLIFDNSPKGSYASISDIIIEFPQNIHQPELIAFDKVKKIKITPLSTMELGVQNKTYFQLELQDIAFGDGSAEYVVDTIKGQFSGVSMADLISFDVDSGETIMPHAAIELSLNLLCGNGLLIQKNELDGKIYFVNRTFFDISVSALVTDVETAITPPLVINKNSVVQVPATVTADNFLTTIPKYTYNLSQDYNNSVLAEMRTSVQNVTDCIIFTNNTGLFSLYHIKQIDITTYIVLAGETDLSKALRTIAISVVTDGVINYMPFVLPIGQYSSKWSVVYSTNILFADGSTQQNNVQVIDDLNTIGKVINLTVSNLNLPKLF